LGRRPLGAILHSSNEPGELSQWLCHDDSTINIVVLIIIIIIIIYVCLAPQRGSRNLWLEWVHAELSSGLSGVKSHEESLSNK